MASAEEETQDNKKRKADEITPTNVVVVPGDIKRGNESESLPDDDNNNKTKDVITNPQVVKTTTSVEETVKAPPSAGEAQHVEKKSSVDAATTAGNNEATTTKSETAKGVKNIEGSDDKIVKGTNPETTDQQTTSEANNNKPQQQDNDKTNDKIGSQQKKQTADGLVNQYSDPEYSNIRYSIIENDGSPASLIKLVGLKSLFAKQLPKMPRAYIARLVFDKRHVSLAILSSDPNVRDTDEEIIGAICYRPFHEQRFAEIAFCAVNGNHQVKGYGTKLMILLKQHAARDGIEYFITYADNFAIGYFKKQGFTKTITMPKGRYHGLIKDYDGGTPMECYIHPSIDFTRINQMVEAQRKFILDRIMLTAKSATAVYQPVRKLQVEESPLSRSHPSIAKAMSIPGVAEAGWTVADLMPDSSTGRDGGISSAALKTELLEAIRKISEQQYAWPFREPVNVEEVPDYLDIIKHPIDLKTMERKAKQDVYKTKQMLFNDVMLMCDNCRVFNEDGSQYTQCANKVERYTRNLMPDCTRQTPKK